MPPPARTTGPGSEPAPGSTLPLAAPEAADAPAGDAGYPTRPVDFLAIGHVARDLLPDGWRLGGAVAFAACQADRLDRRPALVTSAGSDVDLGALPDLPIHNLPATCTTCYENHYELGGRRQWLRARAGTIEADAVPEAWWSARMCLLAPIAGEIGQSFGQALARRPKIGVTGLALQGWLRDWDSSGRVRFAFWPDPDRLLEHADVAFVSEAGLAPEPAALAFYADRVRCLVVTRGELGCAIYHSGRRYLVPGKRARVVDPTGAGDVFATAFLIRWEETGDLEEAARFANAAASLAIEGPGLTAIPTRPAIERRMADDGP